MMTNQNSLETKYHYNDQSERLWDRVSLCWPVRMILRQGVIMLTNQNRFETKCHCADQSEFLHLRISQCSDNVALTISRHLFIFVPVHLCDGAHAWRGEEKLWEWGSFSGSSSGSQSVFPRGAPQVHILNVSFPLRYSWRHQLREFKSEYRVVALDLRGYGESDAPTHQESYKLDCLIADIKDILDSLGRLAFWILLMCAYVFLCLCGCMHTCVCRDLQSPEEGTGVFGSHRCLWACSAHWDPQSSLLMGQ